MCDVSSATGDLPPLLVYVVELATGAALIRQVRLGANLADDPASTRQAREKGRLLDGRKRDYQPLAAIKFHVRIRGAPCVGFFSCHVAQSFSLGKRAAG